MKYFKTQFKIIPNNEINTDILSALLGEIDYESFEITDNGINAYIQVPLYNETKLLEVINNFPQENVNISFANETMPDKDWNEEWEKNFFQPIVVDHQCTIYSTKHSDVARTRYNIIINPKLAFGTGTHQTTRLLIKEILDHDISKKSLLDMGCGTSVLAILASMKEADPITAIDIDEWCIENSKENFLLNGIHNINVFQGDASSLKGLESFDLIIANINRNILLRDMDMYVSVMHKNSIIWMSGFYTQDINILTPKAQELGLTIIYQKSLENWAVIKFIKN